jgi:nucleoside 2-deoxyribosyltransferase
MISIQPHCSPRRVYCAGPLFNAAERREMVEIAEILRQGGFDPFVPHADGLEFTPVREHLIQEGWAADRVGHFLHEAIFALDTYQVVEGCGSLVFNMNGRVPDEGGVAELTMAWMLGKPIVIVKDDVRTEIAGRDNPLVVGQTGFRSVQGKEQIVPALNAELARRPTSPADTVLIPDDVALAVEKGARLWQRLTRLDASRPSGPVAGLIVALFEHSQPAAASIRAAGRGQARTDGNP